MAEYLIQDTTLTGIADSIRAARGIAGAIPLSNFAIEISNIINNEMFCHCYVGMMPPYNNVGDNGDIFFLV